MIKGEKIPQKYFSRQLVHLVHAMTKIETPYPLNQAGATRGVLDAVRKDGIGHYPESIIQRKCVMSKKSVKIQCSKCGKTPHLMFYFQINSRTKIFQDWLHIWGKFFIDVVLNSNSHVKV